MTQADSRRRIFVVEDEALIMMEITDRLAKLGYAVCGKAARGEAAVERIAQLRPDLVLMDINLAGSMDGIEVARRAREDCPAPIVFLTAYSDQALITRARDAGAFGYLVKPFHERELYATIEVALERQRAEMEMDRRVRERTASLERANGQLETFTYSVAHDLKAPLRGIEGYSQLLLENYADRLDATGRQYLGNVRRAALQMDALIDGLLAYSRLEHQEMHAGPVDARALVDALLAERADEIGRRGVAVDVALTFATVSADREALELALRNLLENALKFTRDVARPAIEIGGRDQGGRRILWMSDNGPGFDMQYHDRIFLIFQRLHRAEDYGGTGVGLAIVKKAMERMGGRVWAECAPGRGATFYLDMPQ